MKIPDQPHKKIDALVQNLGIEKRGSSGVVLQQTAERKAIK